MSPYYQDSYATLYHGSAGRVLSGLPAESVQTCVTSPPYWRLRNYGTPAQVGLERTPEEYVARIFDIFREVRRVLRDDGTLWLNLGDSYAAGGHGGHQTEGNGTFHGHRKREGDRHPKKAPLGLKPKDLVGIPWRVAFALQADGWYLRQDIIWHKPNPMPESVRDRCTKAHEYIFLLAKSRRYYYDAEAIREPDKHTDHKRNVLRRTEPSGGVLAEHSGLRQAGGRNGRGRNKRSVWTVRPDQYPGAHFATFPPELIAPCILAGSPPGGVVLDPFAGTGTTLAVAKEHNRKSIGVDLNAEYLELCKKRLRQEVLPLWESENNGGSEDD